MFDGLKGGPVNVDYLALVKKLPFEGRYSQETGEDTTGKAAIAHHKGFTFSAYTAKGSTNLLLAGSIHKFFNDGKHNYNNFSVKDLLVTLTDFWSILDVAPQSVSLHNLEFGVNIVLPFDVNILLTSLLTYKGIPFERPIENRYYYQCQTAEFIIKIYDKGRQYSLPQNLVRVEIKVVKMRFLQTKGINIKNTADLLCTENYPKLGSLLVEYVSEILFRNRLLETESFGPKDRELVLNGNNKEYWLRPKLNSENKRDHEAARKKQQREEARYRQLNQQDWINDFLIKGIIDKWQDLTNVDEGTLSQIHQVLRECPKFTESDESECPKFTAKQKSECPKITKPKTEQMSQIHTLYVEAICDKTKTDLTPARYEPFEEMRGIEDLPKERLDKPDSDTAAHKRSPKASRPRTILPGAARRPATFNVEINSRANHDGLHSIFVRITQNRKSQKVMMEFRIPFEQFNKQARQGKWIRSSFSKHAVYNAAIEQKIADLKEARVTASEGLPGAESFEKSPNGEITVKEYFDKHFAKIKSDSSIGYQRHVKSKMDRFVNYFDDKIKMNEIAPVHISEYKIFLLSKGLKGTTLNDNMKRVCSVFRSAIADDTIVKDPFRAHTRAKSVLPDRIKLNDEQIKVMVELDLIAAGGSDWTHHCRNFYLFSYYNAGIRIADLIQLRQCNVTSDGRLEYEMDKTGHKKSIALNSGSWKILTSYYRPEGGCDEYLFPILQDSEPYAKYVTYLAKRTMAEALRNRLFNHISSQTALINKELKVIGELSGITRPLSFHTARHSFADKARRAMKKTNKITLVDIMNSLGHKHLSTTQAYFNSFDKESLDEAMDAVFSQQ
ncbi:tyrosine-type recombinase/integrase [Dyadobacter alkalitolerans]|uniref:tyrosine-type recombinase/integrase n=1 Tax=Dyadobacter alkalitolerans TaxID=492736 RepID=UPI0003F70A50|nr:tyrosine-type recombinase/integrase [Dyadobacter alkalitolerans]